MSRSMTLLGTGAGDGGTHRNRSAVLIPSQDGAILLDAGEPCAQTLHSLGLSREYLRAIFISHTHADHVAGLPSLLQEKQMGDRHSPLPVFLPRHLRTPLLDWLRVLAMPQEEFPFNLSLHDLAAGCPQHIEDLTIIPFATTHDHQGERESFGFEVRRGAQRIVYSADLGRAEDLLSVLQEPATYLIVELAHITPDDIVRTLGQAAARVESLLLTHVGKPYLPELAAIRAYLDRALPSVGNVFTPMDGESFPF